MLKPKFIKFKVIIIVEPDGDCFRAYSPPLKGLHVNGKSVDEVKIKARDAAIIHFKTLIKGGDPIPLGVGKIVKKKKESKVFNLIISINLAKNNRIIAALRLLMKKVATQLNRWAA